MLWAHKEKTIISKSYLNTSLMPEKFSRNTLGKILENLRHEIIFSDDLIIFYQINLLQNQQLR